MTRNIPLILILLLAWFEAHTQARELESNTIWSVLYPNNKTFDRENNLIRKVKRSDANELRTQIKKIFYYAVRGQQKAIVILYAYNYYDGNLTSCHPCHPDFDIATFALSGDNWIKQKFTQNWKEATGSYGEGEEISFKKLGSINCIVLTSSYGNGGEFYDYTTYYDAETLMKVKTIKSKS